MWKAKSWNLLVLDAGAVVGVARLLLDKYECHIFYMSAKETFLGIMTLMIKHEWSAKKPTQLNNNALQMCVCVCVPVHRNLSVVFDLVRRQTHTQEESAQSTLYILLYSEWNVCISEPKLKTGCVTSITRIHSDVCTSWQLDLKEMMSYLGEINIYSSSSSTVFCSI